MTAVNQDIFDKAIVKSVYLEIFKRKARKGLKPSERFMKRYGKIISKENKK